MDTKLRGFMDRIRARLDKPEEANKGAGTVTERITWKKSQNIKGGSSR